MKATIIDIKRFAVHDGDGIRTTVFFKGCPLHCIWCHNPESIGRQKRLALMKEKCIGCGECGRVCPNGAHRFSEKGHTIERAKCIGCGRCAETCPVSALRLYGRTVDTEELLPLLLADRAFYENSGGGVTLSGGECLLQADFCADLLARLKAEGVRTAVDTSGAVPRKALMKVLPYTDVFLYDLKAMEPTLHEKLTWRRNEDILENLRFLSESGARIEIRIPLVRGYNDGDVPAMAEFLRGLRGVIRVRVLAYHDLARSKYESLDLPDTMPRTHTGKEDVDRAVGILRKAGVPAVSSLE